MNIKIFKSLYPTVIDRTCITEFRATLQPRIFKMMVWKPNLSNSTLLFWTLQMEI